MDVRYVDKISFLKAKSFKFKLYNYYVINNYMTYRITNYTRQQAAKYGLTVKPSQVKDKKISVYKGDEYLGSVGAIGYDDYPTFKNKYGISHANERRRLYHMRHRHENGYNEKYSRSFLASRLLW